MVYTKTNVRNVEGHNGLHFLREPLHCEQLGFSIIDVDGEREGLEHDNIEDGQEEVYFLVTGSATLTIEGEDVDLTPGDAVRVSAEATRKLTIHKASQVVIAGAP